MTDTIKTRPDGSIDTAFYMARGRQMRSQQAADMARTGSRKTLSLVPVLAIFGLAVLVIVPGLL
ncbi:hypothetical protein [Nioella sp. MMSF_3534]|uniref:hypothetical protein n=1 Tax=Nioella sp. MMSF_3534 TaxID=3046720 RepID=UPI00273E059E|nr:hypothetical protein [Nioella sp. MMSF_3534]